MKKFRVLSDLHVDPGLNAKFPVSIEDKSTFTVVCGDLAGDPKLGHEWVKKNMTSGIVLNGNHMPYNEDQKTMQEQREALAKRYPLNSDITYLDAEVGLVKKEVDGIVFLGSCMYSDMRIPQWRNECGDVTTNKMITRDNMNDFHWGIKEKKWLLGEDNEPTLVKMTPSDYEEWFFHAFKMIDQELTENEKLAEPKPVVLLTHYVLDPRMLEHCAYESVKDNYAAYGSDRVEWLKSHPSLKCWCCGHAHDVYPDWRNYKIERDDGSSILVVNNARGYVKYGHDYNFNPNTFVNTETWEVEKIPESEEEIARKKKV